ncbi:MAG: Chromate resistance protein ChrB [Mycobacteriaceae bacterium]
MVAKGTATGEWVLLVYRLPREPSTPRSSVWRRLRRLGAAQLGDGLVALPADARTREQLDWVAAEVQEAGGQAMVWLAHPSSEAEERQVVHALQEARAREYAELHAAAVVALEAPVAEQRRSLAKLRRRMREVRRRDFFPPPQRGLADAAMAALGTAVARGAPSEVSAADVPEPARRVGR